MSNELSTNVGGGLAPVQTESALSTKEMKDVGNKYLGYIQLLSSSAKPVKSGKAPMGQYGYFAGSEFKQALGDTFVCVIVAIRKTAMRFGDTPETFHDPSSEAYKEIEAIAARGGMSGCSEGPEYLCYIPSIGKWAHYLFGNASHKRSAGLINEALVTDLEGNDLPDGQFMPRVFEFKVRFVENYKPKGGKEKVDFHAPVVELYKGELEEGVVEAIQSGSEIIKNFITPPAPPEQAEDVEDEG